MRVGVRFGVRVGVRGEGDRKVCMRGRGKDV